MFTLKMYMLKICTRKLSYTSHTFSKPQRYQKIGSHGIEPKRDWPTFLKLDLWSLGAGFIPIITSNVLNLIKKKNSRKKNQFYAYKKHLTQFLKMGSILFWVQFHAYWNLVLDFLILKWNFPHNFSTISAVLKWVFLHLKWKKLNVEDGGIFLKKKILKRLSFCQISFTLVTTLSIRANARCTIRQAP